MKITALLALFCLTAIPCQAALADDGLTTADAIGLSQQLSLCAGLFDALSVMAGSWGKESMSTTLHEQHNGARLAAMWLLAYEYEQRTGENRQVGKFAKHVDGIVSSSRTYDLAMIKNGGGVIAVEDRMQQCVALHELQSAVVDYIRTLLILQDE